MRYVGWSHDGAPVESEPIPEDWFARTTARTLAAVERDPRRKSGADARQSDQMPVLRCARHLPVRGLAGGRPAALAEGV